MRFAVRQRPLVAVVITAAEKEEVRSSIKSEKEWVKPNPDQVLLEPKPNQVIIVNLSQTVAEVWYVCRCYALTVSLFREQ